MRAGTKMSVARDTYALDRSTYYRCRSRHNRMGLKEAFPGNRNIHARKTLSELNLRPSGRWRVLSHLNFLAKAPGLIDSTLTCPGLLFTLLVRESSTSFLSGSSVAATWIMFERGCSHLFFLGGGILLARHYLVSARYAPGSLLLTAWK